MAWTYNVAQLATSVLFQVRLLIGDVLTTDQQLQDEEILYLISTRATNYGAAAECCLSLQAKFSRTVDQGAGNTRVNWSQMAKAYGLKAIEFENKAAKLGAAKAYSGGTSLSDMQIQELNNDRVAPQFAIGITDNLNMPVGPSGVETLSQTDGLGPPSS
jgi:hypothetical protein